MTTPGTWVAGPEMVFDTNNLGAVDAPAAMMANGKILCALGPTNGFNGPTYFYEYDYLANSFTQVNGPTGATLSSAPFVMTMLDLPDGSILFVSGQGSRNLYVYFPDGSPVPAGQPVINSISMNADGSYHVSGTGFNGLSGGGACQSLQHRRQQRNRRLPRALSGQSRCTSRRRTVPDCVGRPLP